jgi:hypothetical protein
MFGLFKSPPFSDPQLGELTRSRGHWRGSLTLAGGESVPLVLSGTKTEPDAQAIAVAKEVPAQFASWRATIEKELFEHYEPYAEALAAGKLEPMEEPFPEIKAQSGVWPHVKLVYVAVTPWGDTLTVELGYTTGWDVEHTLGALFQSGKFIELNGSVLQP